jgi:3-hydroxyacyl-[acyl-carrier-protein] dehydratase
MSLEPETILWVRQGEGAAAKGRVPQDAPYFQDHFPEFPVLPGVLSLDILKQTADTYLKQFRPGEKSSVREMKNVKFSSYLRPGDEWESLARMVSEAGRITEWDVRLTHQNKTAASARMVLSSESI